MHDIAIGEFVAVADARGGDFGDVSDEDEAEKLASVVDVIVLGSAKRREASGFGVFEIGTAEPRKHRNQLFQHIEFHVAHASLELRRHLPVLHVSHAVGFRYFVAARINDGFDDFAESLEFLLHVGAGGGTEGDQRGEDKQVFHKCSHRIGYKNWMGKIAGKGCISKLAPLIVVGTGFCLLFRGSGGSSWAMLQRH